MLLWLQTTVLGALRRKLVSALFVTVHVSNAELAAGLREWAAQLNSETKPQHSRLTVLDYFTSRRFMERCMRTSAAAGGAPSWFGENLVFFVPGGLLEKSDCLSYTVFKPSVVSAGGQQQSDDEPTGDLSAWFRGRCVWLHTHASGASPAVGLLSGAPAPLLRMMDNAGLRDLLAPSKEQGPSDNEGAAPSSSVYMSVLRWHGNELITAALLAAYRRMKAESCGTVQLFSVRGTSWSRHPPLAARPMRTVVLSKEARDMRRMAKRFLSARYRAFCRVEGVPHRCGYALWGYANCALPCSVARSF